MGDNITEDEMQRLYQWIDDIPLSRPKRNIGRDFSDGGLSIYSSKIVMNLTTLMLCDSLGGGVGCTLLPQAGGAA